MIRRLQVKPDGDSRQCQHYHTCLPPYQQRVLSSPQARISVDEMARECMICLPMLEVNVGINPGTGTVAAEVTHLAFDAALLMAFAGRAEIGLILPVRTEIDEASRHLALVAAQDLLHRTASAEPCDLLPESHR